MHRTKIKYKTCQWEQTVDKWGWCELKGKGRTKGHATTKILHARGPLCSREGQLKCFGHVIEFTEDKQMKLRCNVFTTKKVDK